MINSQNNLPRQFSIIDVREDGDFHGGHIATAKNIPSNDWTNDGVVESVAESHRGTGTVIIHCMHSKVRGPTCALKLMEFLEASDIPEEEKPEV